MERGREGAAGGGIAQAGRQRVEGCAGSGDTSGAALWLEAPVAGIGANGLCAGADLAGGIASRSGGPGAIEIEFASGARMRVTGAVDVAALTAAVAALAHGRRR